MAQDREVMALRKRMRNRGYTDVRIERTAAGTYLVQGIEPLAGVGVQAELSADELSRVMR